MEAEAAERAQHPLYYADTITAYADAQELDLALSPRSSSANRAYDPQSGKQAGRTRADAADARYRRMGCPQARRGRADYSFDNLYDPQTNIRFGTWYLGYLSRRFDGDATKIVCASIMPVRAMWTAGSKRTRV